MTTQQIAMAAGALGAVLLLAVVAARLVRAFGGGLPIAIASPGSARSLRLRETLPLGAGRRLHHIEANGRSLLILTGGGQDVLLPWPKAGEPS